MTKEEKNAIKTLKRLAKRWPKSLWLFAVSGGLCVMQKSEKGEHVFFEGKEALDPGYIVDTIKIDSSGGDW